LEKKKDEPPNTQVKDTNNADNNEEILEEATLTCFYRNVGHTTKQGHQVYDISRSPVCSVRYEKLSGLW